MPSLIAVGAEIHQQKMGPSRPAFKYYLGLRLSELTRIDQVPISY